MRRTLAIAVLGIAATFGPMTAASAAPDCDIAQNCVCLTANGVLERATGYSWLHCV